MRVRARAVIDLPKEREQGLSKEASRLMPYASYHRKSKASGEKQSRRARGVLRVALQARQGHDFAHPILS